VRWHGRVKWDELVPARWLGRCSASLWCVERERAADAASLGGVGEWVRSLVVSTTPTGSGGVRGHTVVAVGIWVTGWAEAWTLNSLAEAVHLSRSQLVRAFDATIGVSPMAYLRRMWVEQMARLLSTTDLTIAEAARSLGWVDANYASRCIHSRYGSSPTEFRRQHSPAHFG
jgi:AraC-like DNA-binding protein